MSFGTDERAGFITDGANKKGSATHTLICKAAKPICIITSTMGTMASQIASLTIVYSTVYSGAD